MSPSRLLLRPCLLLSQSALWRGSAWAAFSSSASSSSSSCRQQHEQQPAPSLRGELGGGAALGSLPGSASGSSDTAARRESLLNARGRFYDTVTVQPAPQQQQPSQQQQQQQPSQQQQQQQHGFQVVLKTYPVKTPAKRTLVLPTRSLALAVAAEWEWLPAGKPAPHLMPLTGLAATALDQPKERPRVIEHLLKYVHTDAACIRYEPGPLQRRQAATFDPLLAWARDALGWRLTTTDSIFGATQPAATVAAVERYFQGLDAWHLAAAEQLVTASKSVVVAAALLAGRLSVAEAVAASRLEEDFQLEDWGMVEAGHDLDIADARTRIGAPAALVRLLALP